LRNEVDIAALLAGEPRMRKVLDAVAGLGLPDTWVTAGFIRNAVWNALHGRDPGDPADLADVDVLFFDSTNLSAERERTVETALASFLPSIPWSARNQARMHLRNGDLPYSDTADALRYWLETATAVAARLRDGKIELLAPYGVNDLLGIVLRPTPPTAARPRKMAEYRARVHDKGWLARWPGLVVHGIDSGSG
jgi:hypothetical protein